MMYNYMLSTFYEALYTRGAEFSVDAGLWQMYKRENDRVYIYIYM